MAKILVADDNSNIQKMVGLALKDQGIDVVAVGNGEAAVRKISDIHPDLVLADVFMPVRNGYEVCRYVKEDSALSHIPVILLVGAFDPLDEQEAQRVGADGVLKKPFVPPDPLIAMVKSALTRAGVPLGHPPAAEKAPEPPPRSTADILSAGMGSKLAALSPEKLPEVTPEPLEELPTPPQQVKIAAGSEPLAFGSLLDTSDAEDLAVTSKPMIDLSSKKWEEDSEGVEEEKEEGEEEPRGGWRPGGLDEKFEGAGQAAQSASDWRDAAFHGNSPASTFSSTHWSPPVESREPAAAAEPESVAVATALPKPIEDAVPFSGDAWASAMASGIEQKIADLTGLPAVESNSEAPEPHSEQTQHLSETSEAPQEAPVIETAAHGEAVPFGDAENTQPSSEPANWAPVPEAAWEMEAKKAALLASTWDAPKAFSVDDTQEIPAYSEAPVEHSQAVYEAPAEQSAYSTESIHHEASGHAEPSMSEPEAPVPVETTESKNWENAWEAPAPAEEPVAEIPPAAEQAAEPVALHEAPAEEPASIVTEESVPAQPVTAETAAQPDIDELVNRVLGKMNPEVLQRVTREILKPVIEAVVRAELDRKGS
ncbi:MAG TPA: response regulator [Candidatus Eremiobacteraceae bacterium]|nr:response regulator [Candidatus Eremiobacteraceae bacterium]